MTTGPKISSWNSRLVGVDVGEHGRVDEVTLAVEPVPAGHDLDAVGLALVEVAQHAGELLLADQRADHAALFVGAAQFQAFATFAMPSTTWS